MSVSASTDATAADDPVWAVGRVVTPAGTELWPAHRSERIAAAAAARKLLTAHGVGPRDAVVVVSLMGEGVQFVPLEDAIEALRAVVMPVDATTRDVGRLVSFVRGFPLRAVVGLGRPTVEALAEVDSGLELLNKVPLVFARTEVCSTLEAAGVTALACDLVGPTLAIECPAREGAHILGGWTAAVDGDEIVLSSDRHAVVRTGIRRALVQDQCSCGLDAPRVVVR